MKRILTLFLITILTAINSFAVSPLTGEKPFTLKECINIALDRNIQIIQAQNTIEINQGDITIAIGSFLPNLSIAGNWYRSNQQRETMTIQGVEIPFHTSQTSNSFNTGISSTITLFDGLANISNLDIAKSNALSSEYNLSRTRQGVIMQVYAYYFNVLRTKQLLKLRQDNVTYSKQQFDRIKESERLGAVSLANVYQQQAQLAQDELNLTTAENDFNKAKADLMAFLALNMTEEVQFDDPSVKTEIDAAEYSQLRNSLENFKSLVDKAYDSRPDYKSSLEGLNAASASVTAARGGIFPIISGSVSYGLNSSYLDKLTNNKSLSWGIGIRLPIFSNFQTDTRIEQAKIQLKNNQEVLKDKERLIQVDIKKAILDLEASYKSYESAKKSSAFQKENMRIIQEKYNLGSSTLLDLLFATNNYNNAETTRITSTYQYLTAIKQVEYALGTLSN